MAKNVMLLVYPVKDIEKAKAFYGKFLGVEPYVDSPYYVGYKTGDMEVGLDPSTSVGPIAYTDVEDLTAAIKELTDAGGEIVQDVKTVAQGLQIAQVKDATGNVVGIRHQA